MASAFETFVDAIHDDARLAGVRYTCFRKESKLASDWPQVSWVPRGGAIGRSDQTGGLEHEGAIVSSKFVDVVATEIHIWHETYEGCELLRNAVLASIEAFLGPERFEPGEYETFNEQDATAEWALSGVKMTLSCTVELVIGTERKDANVITSEVHIGTFVSKVTGSEETVC